MIEQKKALVLVPPASGHLNPICSIVHELVTKRNVKAIFFGLEKYRKMIEKTGAEFREYSEYRIDDKLPSDNKKFNPIAFFGFLLKNAATLFPELVKCCDKEKPDFIIFDQMSLHAKFLVSHLELKEKKKQLKYTMPKTVLIHTGFASVKNVYPNKEEMNLMMKDFSIKLVPSFLGLIIKQINFNKKLKLNLSPNIIELFNSEAQLNMCAVFHELQPRADNMAGKIRFPGCCIQEEVRSVEVTDEKLRNILNSFKPINPVNLPENIGMIQEHSKKLIYVSLGTVFNKFVNVFEKIIKAFATFDQESSSFNNPIKSKDLQVIISLGDISFKAFEEKIRNEGYVVPDNVLLLPFAPQIEILKRASLYICHCGMNSTSETIHYGVPIVSLPINADQPLVSRRICDELNLGIRLDFQTATAEDIRKAVYQVLNDRVYHENILEFSAISRKYNGIKNAADLIENFIN